MAPGDRHGPVDATHRPTSARPSAQRPGGPRDHSLPPLKGHAMRFGVCVMANIDEIGFFPHAEALGFDSVWVTDSQMLFSDCYVVLALAARETTRLRLGPGTAICGTRIAPVHAAAMATLNRMAPGRVHLGIGTGNT